MTLRLLVCAALLVATAPVAGQVNDPSQFALARTLFEEGVEAFDAGRLDEAEDRFRRSLAIRSSSGVRYNLGQVLTRQGKLVEAREFLVRVRSDESAPPDVRDAARALAAELDDRVAHIVIAAREGDSVQVDDSALAAAAFETPFPVDPGVHRVHAERDGVVLLDREEQLTEGQTWTVSVTAAESAADVNGSAIEGGSTGGATVGASMGDAATGDASTGDGAAESGPVEEPDGSVDPLLVGVGAALLGVGVLAGVAAGVTGGLALDRLDELRAECPEIDGGRSCPEALAPVHDEYVSLATTNTALLPVAIAAAAAGAVLVILGVSGGGSDRATVGPDGLTARF